MIGFIYYLYLLCMFIVWMRCGIFSKEYFHPMIQLMLLVLVVLFWPIFLINIEI